MVLLHLGNRCDRTFWRVICKSTNGIYLEELSGQRGKYSKLYSVDIHSDMAPLLTPTDFWSWTSICYRSTENAFLSARLLWQDLDSSKRAQEKIDHDRDEDPDAAEEEDGYENIDGDIRQREVETTGRTIVDTLRIYVGNLEFETLLRGLVTLVHTKRRLEKYDMLWAHSLFYSWINSHLMHEMSTFSIALLLMDRYHCDGRFDNSTVRRMQAFLEEHSFRAFFHNCFSGDNERICAAFQMVGFLNEPDQWLIEEGIAILQYRGYSAGVWKNRFNAHHYGADAALADWDPFVCAAAETCHEKSFEHACASCQPG